MRACKHGDMQRVSFTRCVPMAVPAQRTGLYSRSRALSPGAGSQSSGNDPSPIKFSVSALPSRLRREVMPITHGS